MATAVYCSMGMARASSSITQTYSSASSLSFTSVASVRQV